MSMGRWFGALWIAVSLCTCGGQAQAPQPAAESPPPEPPPPRTFSASSVGPSEHLVQLRELVDTDAARAQREAESALETAEPLDAGRLRWIAASAAAGQGNRTAAESHWTALSQSEHPLSRWAALRLAESLEAHEPARAVEVAHGLTNDWAAADRAKLIEARALLASEETERALVLLRALVRAAPDGVGAASAGMPLAEHLRQSESVEDREEALGLYRRVMTRAPKARVAGEAERLAGEVLESLPRERREALEDIPVADRFVQAEALYNGMHHVDAERAYAALAHDLRDDPEARCRAQLEQGKAMLRRRRREQGSAHMAAVAERCRDTDVRAWARYKAGRAFAQLGQNAQALAQYAALLEEAPAHRLADDAVFRSALVDEGTGDTESMLRRFASMPERFPEGDMVGEALFRLALHARERAEHAEALRWLETSLGEDGRGRGEDDEDIRGRAAYWRARTLLDLERADEAKAGFEALIRRWPLGYYAQQAFARLRAIDEARAEELLGSMRSEERPDSFAWQGAMDAPWFKRFVELSAVGAVDEAMSELRHHDAHRDGEMVWVAAAVFAQGGALPEVARLVRWRLDAFRHEPPVGDAHRRWRLAYPQAFAPVIEEAASNAEVPASFVRAVAREESSFNPRAVSWAHAYGLVQLILPTARRYGRELDLHVSAHTLKQPAVNLAIGARYMRHLRDRYAANPALVPAAYNAGEGALDRWIRQRGDLAFDEFVERIPYDETRRYTRRVVQTWGIYSFLDEGTLPPLPSRVR